ncbi:cytochrome C [Rhizobium leguminosarum]|uniref:c-type cytochrome n=1 Tax=Rhizobium TaxID=379 RepID=UPI001C929E0F|nr:MULTISPECIES: cytochrome c [Rhizobium]MBY3488979.1 cytochrome C [Rhizobium laguerreae]MBY5571911.1 cytochrome C [Rhizobium leguminosarum]MBY5578447.1 cytochrome C [Rhizobium leguminosarum]MBY5585133.1 cytochrome C [Rhizobium leguminosarum]MBY5734309.1 cytochrome C [Rhizobium leguminosarum]
MQIADARLSYVMAALVLAFVSIGVAANFVKDRERRQAVAIAMTSGDPRRAPVIFRRYGCAGCHVIPGVPGADGKVGGPLTDLRQRVYIGGVANNTSENLVQWIVFPQRFSANSAMPATGISEVEARDLAAYLYAQ